MKRTRRLLLCLAVCVVIACSRGVGATEVDLFVDSAPNNDIATWWSQAKSDVAGGTFTNLANGVYPGLVLTKYWIDPYDEIVYNTGDMGWRLEWVYWVPGMSVSELTGCFEVKVKTDWYGTVYAVDFPANSLVPDGPDVGWYAPTTWEDYNGGVIGKFTFALWAYDDLAPPYDTNGDPFDETDQADIDTEWWYAMWGQDYVSGMVRYCDGQGGLAQEHLTVNMGPPVPEPASVCLLGMALAGAGLRWRRRRAARG